MSRSDLDSEILIDSRIGSRDLADHKSLAGKCVLQILSSADVAFVGNGSKGLCTIGVEVKSVEDLISSLISGRLQDEDGQLDRMSREYDHCYLAVYGCRRVSDDGRVEAKSHEKKRWRYPKGDRRARNLRYIENQLNGISVCGFHVREFLNKDYLAYWLESLHAWWCRSWDSRQTVGGLPQSASSTYKGGRRSGSRAVFAAAQTIPGVGTIIAERASKVFGSVAEMADSEKSDWERLDGISKTTAHWICRYLRGE